MTETTQSTQIFLNLTTDPETGVTEVVGTLKTGEVGIMTTFSYSNYKEFAAALLQQGFMRLAEQLANPPTVVVPPLPKATSSGKKKASKRKATKTPKAVDGPFTLYEGDKRRGLQMLDPFDVQEACMTNKALQFETLAEAKAIARQLVAHTETTIAIKGKGKRVAATLTPNGDADERDDMVYHLLDADAGERLRVSDIDDETIADSYADNDRLEFTDLDEARTAAEAILAVCDLTIHIVDGDDNLVETMVADDDDESDEDTDDNDAVADTKADFPIIEPIRSPDVAKRQRTGKKNKPSLDDIPEDDPQPTLL